MTIEIQDIGYQLRNIIKKCSKEVDLIEFRVLYNKNDTQEDYLFGYCAFKNDKLISLDGDSYSLSTRYYKYEEEDDRLVVWQYGIVKE